MTTLESSSPFASRARDADYLGVRASLERVSWTVVDRFRPEGPHAIISSYPRWKNPADRGDFGLIHPLFAVNGDDCLCIQVAPSPLRESFEDVRALAERSRAPFERALREVATGSAIAAGVVAASWGGAIQQLTDGTPDTAIAGFWANLLSPTPRELLFGFAAR